MLEVTKDGVCESVARINERRRRLVAEVGLKCLNLAAIRSANNTAVVYMAAEANPWFYHKDVSCKHLRMTFLLFIL
jgi:hypothetical protein